MAYKKLKYWFDKDLAVVLSDKIQAHCKSFNGEDFIKAVANGTKNLELKDRVEFIICAEIGGEQSERYPER